jgi:hypothetical protein
MIQTRPFRLLLAMSAGLAACAENPAEVRSEGAEFPVIATWTATVAPVPPAIVTGALTIAQHQGFRMDAALTLTDTTSTDAVSTRYQWRIFRGDCATNTPAVPNFPNGPSPTGLLLFATVQSYPDITVDYASGTGSAAPTIAGNLDAVTAHSVRIRLSQQATNWNGTNPIACGDLQRD